MAKLVQSLTTLNNVTFGPKYPKYVLDKTNTINYKGRTLYRIVYNPNHEVYKHFHGGWIESYSNLSQYDLCAVLDDAKVFGKGKVTDSGILVGNAEVSKNTIRYSVLIDSMNDTDINMDIIENKYNRINRDGHIATICTLRQFFLEMWIQDREKEIPVINWDKLSIEQRRNARSKKSKQNKKLCYNDLNDLFYLLDW